MKKALFITILLACACIFVAFKPKTAFSFNSHCSEMFAAAQKKYAFDNFKPSKPEAWQIWTEPDVNLPFVMIVPKNIEGKVPLVITPHGHGKNFETVRKVYAAAGAPDNCELFIGPKGHRYYFGGADAFVEKHL